MTDISRAERLIGNRDYPAFQSFWAGLTDDRLRAVFGGRYGDGTIVGHLLYYDPPQAVWLTVKAAADRLGVLVLSQADDYNKIPLHLALECCTVVGVAGSVIEGTPPHHAATQEQRWFHPPRLPQQSPFLPGEQC